MSQNEMHGQFEAGEDSELSRDVTVRIENLFKAFKITAVEEVTLGANLVTSFDRYENPTYVQS
jgi:hypothetical protein